MKPYIKINFQQGVLGSVVPSPDNTVGMVVSAVAAPDTFALNTVYILHSLGDLVELGIAKEGTNAYAYEQVSRFYAQAGEGAELWLMGVAATIKPSEVLSTENDYAKKMIVAAKGKIRAIVVAFNPGEEFSPTVQNGLEKDVLLAAANGQALAEWATTTLYAPLIAIIEGRNFNEEQIVSLEDLSEKAWDRVAIMIGDITSGSAGAAVATLAGRIAQVPVQRHIGRVKDGALNVSSAFIGTKDAAVANVDTINDKGYVTFRTFTGKSGYFFCDDNLATSANDDYRSIARRRVIDKASRIAYATMLNHVNDEIPVTKEGAIVPSLAKAWELELITAIANQMTANGELATDPENSADKGVECFIDPTQNVVSTSALTVELRVRPFGYAKYIIINLGFQTSK